MTYPEASAYIASLAQRGWRLGLDRMQEFARLAGLDDYHPAFFHVAGTNGKGTTTAFIQSILVEHGHKTGAFFSPYVYDPRERVQLGRAYIPEEDFARLTTGLREVAIAMEATPFEGPTEFEFKTALGLAYWKENQCDSVALEVGLGGRLDATNIVSPRSTCIVSIGLDHVSILGDTLAEIAGEKAGIVKPGIPVIVGEMADEAAAVIADAALLNTSQLWRFGRDIVLESSALGYSVAGPGFHFGGLHPGLRGSKIPHNMSVAISCLVAGGVSLDLASVQRGVERATCPGRYEKISAGGNQFILDGAHNADSARALAESLRADGVAPGSLILITNMLSGHDPTEFYSHLREFVKEVWVVPINFPRARTVSETAAVLRGVFGEVRKFESLADVCALASSLVGERVLITGSFYLLGDWRRASI